MKKIIIRGAREHNLKDISLELPRDKFIVFTGISGSGKSTLAFDTIFAEGQRRYLESLSSYARQFLGQMEKPDVDYIEGLSPTISISQKAASHNPRSTVGTITEIYDYMRLFFAKIGIMHCTNCGKTITVLSIEQMVDKILEFDEKKKIKIFSPIVKGRKGEYVQLLNDMYKRGYSKARVDGEIIKLDEKIDLARYKMHNIDIFIDEVEVNSSNISRLFEDVENALNLSGGFVLISWFNKEILMNKNFSCSSCNLSFVEIEPRLFSYNSPYGACEACNGLGARMEIDPKLVLPDRNKTIAEGAFLPWSYKPNNYYGAILNSVCQKYRIPLNVRLKDVPKEKADIVLYGNKSDDLIEIRYFMKGKSNFWQLHFSGLVNDLEKRYFKTESPAVRKEIEKYMSTSPCKTCGGKRLKKEALHVKVGGQNIAEVSSMSIKKAIEYFDNLKLSSRETLTVGKVLEEIRNRLKFLIDVGLDYLTLDRSGTTLAGGEAQRIRLASQIGSALVGVLYVLDEPSIGLHARDNKRLIKTLKHLRDLGNTLIVVEHDEETMRESDFLIDLGPGAGKHGGEIVFSGTFNELLKCGDSITGAYLAGRMKIEIPKERRRIGKNFITVYGARENNLKNIGVSIPLRVFTCITGVSGSGKSSLVNEIIYKSLARKLHRSMEKPGVFKKIDGTESIDKVIQIDQSPVG